MHLAAVSSTVSEAYLYCGVSSKDPLVSNQNKTIIQLPFFHHSSLELFSPSPDYSIESWCCLLYGAGSVCLLPEANVPIDQASAPCHDAK